MHQPSSDLERFGALVGIASFGGVLSELLHLMCFVGLACGALWSVRCMHYVVFFCVVADAGVGQ